MSKYKLVIIASILIVAGTSAGFVIGRYKQYSKDNVVSKVSYNRVSKERETLKIQVKELEKQVKELKNQ